MGGSAVFITILHGGGGGGGGLPDLLQYYMGGGLPDLLQYYMGGGRANLLQYYMGGGGSSETPKLYYVIYEQPLNTRAGGANKNQV